MCFCLGTAYLRVVTKYAALPTPSSITVFQPLPPSKPSEHKVMLAIAFSTLAGYAGWVATLCCLTSYTPIRVESIRRIEQRQPR